MTHSKIQGKIQGKFYALQEDQLKEMKKAGLINNTAYVLLGLKVENPFGDKLKLIVEDFAARWQLPTVSVYKALARLKQKGQINIETGTLMISFNSDTNYQSGNPIIKNDNELSELITDYQNRNNEDLKPLPDKEPDSSQIIQTNKTPQTADSASSLQAEGGDEDQIPEAILNRVRKLGIYLDKKIKQAIVNSTRSQVEKALTHIETTAQSIRSKYGVFLYQLSLKEENSAGDVFRNFPEGFLNWYNSHRGELLEDIDPEYLPRDRYGEPQVRLKSRPKEYFDWRRVNGEDEENSFNLEDNYVPGSIRETLERMAPGLKARWGLA